MAEFTQKDKQILASVLRNKNTIAYTASIMRASSYYVSKIVRTHILQLFELRNSPAVIASGIIIDYAKLSAQKATRIYEEAENLWTVTLLLGINVADDETNEVPPITLDGCLYAKPREGYKYIEVPKNDRGALRIRIARRKEQNPYKKIEQLNSRCTSLQHKLDAALAERDHQRELLKADDVGREYLEGVDDANHAVSSAILRHLALSTKPNMRAWMENVVTDIRGQLRSGTLVPGIPKTVVDDPWVVIEREKEEEEYDFNDPDLYLPF